MAWITLADAQAGAGTTAQTSAAAESIWTWLDGAGAVIGKGHDFKTNTVYSRNGISLKQEVETETFEIRGIAKDLAEFMAKWYRSDNLTEWLMIGVAADGSLHEANLTYGPAYFASDTLRYYPGEAGSSKSTTDRYYRPTDGSRRECEARQANAAGAWMVAVRKELYPAPDYSINFRTLNRAFIPGMPLEASDGFVTSTNKQKTLVTYDGATPVYQNVSTTVREYRYLTQAAAAAKVAALASNGSRVLDVRVVVSWGTSGSTYKNVQVRGGGNNGTTAATDVIPTSREMGNGYFVVSANEITYQVTNS